MTDALRAAMVRFTTLEPSLWPRVATALHGLGFNTVDLPLVWREHETSPGVFEFGTGRRSVGAALDAVAAAGMRAIVRVGPMPTPDAPGLGLPERVLQARGCQARTRRQNPVVVPDPPRLVPLPSLASTEFRTEAVRWVQAACTAIAPWVTAGTVARVIIGHGPHPALRDDPFEIDHHPDGRPVQVSVPVQPSAVPQETAVPVGAAQSMADDVARETAVGQAYLLALAAAATAAGIPPGVTALAIPGGVMASVVALALTATHRLSLAVPPAAAGTEAIWRQVGYGGSLPGGAHWDVRSGGPAFGAPLRAAHAVQCARAALAAGARDFTVVMGCVGDRWAGALLDERGVVRSSGPLWAAELAWAAALPKGTSEGVTLVTHAGEVTAARAATAVRPLPLGLLSLLFGPPGGLADPNAPCDAEVVPGATLGQRATDRERVERALTAAGVGWHWSVNPADAADPTVVYDNGDPVEFVTGATRALTAVAVRTNPPGGALVRVVMTADGLRAVVLSATDETVTVHPPEGWSGDGATLPPGEALVLRAPAVPGVALETAESTERAGQGAAG